METYISSERVNTGRQFEVDCVKFFAIFFMICIHVYEQLGKYDYHHMIPSGVFRNAMEFLGGPMAAPMFMFTMGIGMVFTHHDSAEEFMKRGWKLLLMGFALNFFRATLLEILGNLILGMDYSFVYIADDLLNIDILQFAGMTFLTVGIMKKAKVTTGGMLAVGIMMQAIGIWVSKFPFPSVILGNLLGLLLPTGEKVAFPLSLWFLYPMTGILFAEYMQRTLDKDRLYGRMILMGVVGVIALSSWLRWAGYDIRWLYALAENSYYHQTLISVLWTLSFLLLVLGTIHFLLGGIEQSKMGFFVCFCSRNLNTIYIIQWLIIAYMVAFVTAMSVERRLSAAGIVLVGMLVSVLTIGITVLLNKKKGRFRLSSDKEY